MTLFDVVRTHADAKPDALAFEFLDKDLSCERRLSYGQLRSRAQAVAAHLARLHRTGDRVMLMFKPGLAIIEAFLGCFAAGVVAVPLQPLQNRRVLPRLQAMMKNAGTYTLLTDSDTRRLLLRFAPEFEQADSPYRLLDIDLMQKGTAPAWRETPVRDEQLAFLQYTSGSTGMPKGVMVSHANVLANQAMIRTAFGHSSETRFVSWLPAYHDMGLIGGIFQPLYLGIPAALMAPMSFLASPATWLRAVSQFGGTTSGAPSFAYELCTDRITDEDMHGVDLSSWRVAFNGAEPVRAAVIEAFSRRFLPHGFRRQAFYPCYGMAETTLLLTGGDPHAAPTRLDVDAAALSDNVVLAPAGASLALVGCGHAHAGHEVVIVDAATRRVLPNGRVGEIWCRGPSVAKGYWADEQRSAEAFAAFTVDGAGPFLRTGDLGFLRHAQLFLTGRLKDVIIVRGQNHYPSDIEATVSGSHEGYRGNGLAAFSTEREGEEQLVVVAELERELVRGLTAEGTAALLAAARRSVSEIHGLRLHELVLIKPATLPRTSSGKVRRGHARTLYEQDQLERIDRSATGRGWQDAEPLTQGTACATAE